MASSWIDDILGAVGDTAVNAIPNLLNTAGSAALNYGINAVFPGATDTQREMAGYQGEIPQYDVLRERVPDTYAADRRPGSGGQRYFTDTQYVPKGQGNATQMDAAGLAALNRLSDGEFVVPADVVAHLGNGNSEAGAKQMFSMMDRIRKARTGNKKQGKKVNPKDYLPA